VLPITTLLGLSRDAGSAVCVCTVCLSEVRLCACAQWDLVCGRAWLVDLVSTVYMAGRLVACLVIGPVSDRCV